MTTDQVGLCSSCAQARRITGRDGAIFWHCRRSRSDPSFPKYPALPVLRCRGYQATEAGASGQPKPSIPPPDPS